MSTEPAIDETAFEPFIETPPLEDAHRCERCGIRRADYVVSSLLEADTSLYCPSCIVQTFAEAAMAILQEEE
jgi:hypothetical protein